MRKIHRRMMILNVIIILVFLGVHHEGSWAHESAHAAIAKNYGCVNDTISVNAIGGGEFRCLEYKGDYDHNMEMRLHSINEIVGYNIKYLVTIIEIGILIIINTLYFLFYKHKHC